MGGGRAARPDEPGLNADFARRVLLHTAGAVWQDSPQAGVQRIPLDRIGAEVARATSLVRFAPGSRFPAHVHGGGEEILVLDGVFSDESGDYPAGSYLRNPPGSRHAPASAPGLRWRMDGKPLGRGAQVAWLPWPGRHVVQLTDARGRVLDELRIEVRGAGVARR